MRAAVCVLLAVALLLLLCAPAGEGEAPGAVRAWWGLLCPSLFAPEGADDAEVTIFWPWTEWLTSFFIRFA